RHVVARGPQVADDDVERHHHARVADVAAVVDRHAARVHPDLALFERNERDLLPGAGVVDPEAHRRNSRPRPARLTTPNMTRMAAISTAGRCWRGRSPSTSR